MGLFDKKPDRPKADFSNVESGSSTQPQAQVPGGSFGVTTYTVKAGDSLSAIAQSEYGDATEWRRIYDANRDLLDDPDVIHPGQELKIPGKTGEL